MLKQKQAYLLAVTLAQIVCALAFLLLTAGQPLALLYGMAAAPVLLFLTFLFGKTRKLCSSWAPLFWLIWVVCFGAFWMHPFSRSYCSIGAYSVTAAVFWGLALLFAIAAPRSSINCFFGIRTPVSTSCEAVWKKVHFVSSFVCAAFTVPLFLLIFWVPGDAKIALCIICLLAAVLGGGFIGQLSARRLIRENRLREVAEREQACRKEQGL